MNKLILSNEDIEFLLKWRDEHKNLVRMMVCPLNAVKIICKDSGYNITGIHENSKLTLGINHNGKSLGKMCYTVIEGGLYALTKNTTKLSEEDQQSCLTVYASAMALLVYGRSTINYEAGEIKREIRNTKKTDKAQNKKRNNRRSGVVYILHREASEPTIMIQGTRNGPRGEFSVRGHFRHYRDGKVVWINQYMKGTGKPIRRTYKLGSDKTITNLHKNN